MFNNIFKAIRSIPKYTIRISPHTKKPEVVRVMRLDIFDPKKHRDDSDDHDMHQLGNYWDWEDDDE